MFSCEGNAIRFILNQFEVLSKRNVERARCNFVMNASGLVVSSWTLRGTHSAAIGLVVRSHLSDVLVRCRIGTFNLEFWIQFKFWVLGGGDVGLRSFFQGRRMWPQAL